MSKLYLSNENSDISGYLLAYVDSSPNSTTISTAVTTTTASGDNIAMTLTEGGTVAKWITKPFLADVAFTAQPVLVNFWIKESDAAANAGVGIRLAEYTTSEQSSFLDFNGTVEATTTSALGTPGRFATAVLTATTIDAGNRLAILPDTVAVGTMGASQTLTLSYGVGTAVSNGNSYIEVMETIRVNERQTASGTITTRAGRSVGAYQETIDRLNEFVAVGLLTVATTVRQAIDELEFERDLN